MAHPLHEIVADVIETRLPPELSLIRDPACLGGQRIPLFTVPDKSRATWVCGVDALIVLHGRIKVVVEIDESDVKPTQVSGKFFNTVIGKYYNHKSSGHPIQMDDATTFFQFLSTESLPEGTSKMQQWENVAQEIRGCLPLKHIAAYELFYGSPDEFRTGDLLGKVDLALDRALGLVA